MAGGGRNRRGTPQFRRGRLVSGILGNEKHLTRLSGSLKPQPGERPIPPGTVGCSGRNCGVAVRIGQPQSQRRAEPFHEGLERLSGNGKRSAGSPPTDGRRARSGNRLHGRRHRRVRRNHNAEDAPPQRIRTLKQPRCKRREIGIRRQRVAVIADSVRPRRSNRSGDLAQQPGSPIRRTATALWKAADMRKPTREAGRRRMATGPDRRAASSPKCGIGDNVSAAAMSPWVVEAFSGTAGMATKKRMDSGPPRSWNSCPIKRLAASPEPEPITISAGEGNLYPADGRTSGTAPSRKHAP